VSKSAVIFAETTELVCIFRFTTLGGCLRLGPFLVILAKLGVPCPFFRQIGCGRENLLALLDESVTINK
jgi:hypothetical protein